MMARRKSSIADDLILLPWWVSVILAAAAYAILPGILPRSMVNGGIVGIVTIASWWTQMRFCISLGVCKLPEELFPPL
jgi:hypothetical protein